MGFFLTNIPLRKYSMLTKQEKKPSKRIKDKSIPGFKPLKDRLTLLLGGNASGDFKLKPLVYSLQNPWAMKKVT